MKMSNVSIVGDCEETIENPVLFVLDNGETILGSVVEENENSFVVEDIVTFAPNGQGGVQTIPYLMFSNQDRAEFSKMKIRHILSPKQDLKDFYSQQFGKIQVPDSNIVVS
jgi:hypothetical protein